MVALAQRTLTRPGQRSRAPSFTGDLSTMPALVFAAKQGAYVHSFMVEQGDIDALGHANNVSFVRWINDAAIAHSTAVGYGIAACVQAGLVWVVRRHDVEYLRPAFAGEQIEALTWPEAMSGATSLRRTLFR